jgi:uncharacterized protein (UPF0548 family)
MPDLLNTADPSTLDASFVHDVHRITCTRSYESAADAVMRYEIFPPSVLSHQVNTDDRRVCKEAIITQWFHLPLFKLKAYVRVIDVRKDDEVTSMTYVTTTGHPECGVAHFEVRRTVDGAEFTIETWSKPGSPLTKIGRPFVRWMQKRSTRQALERFQRGE